MKRFPRLFNTFVGGLGLFTFCIMLFWASKLSHLYIWINGYNTIADYAMILSLIMFILIIVSGVRVVAFIFQHNSTDCRSRLVKFLTSIIFIALFVLQIELMQSSSGWGQNVVTLTNIISKYIEDETPYFIANDSHPIKLKCDEKIYEALLTDKDILYVLSYRRLTDSSTFGVLQSIDTENIVDNRR